MNSLGQPSAKELRSRTILRIQLELSEEAKSEIGWLYAQASTGIYHRLGDASDLSRRFIELTEKHRAFLHATDVSVHDLSTLSRLWAQRHGHLQAAETQPAGLEGVAA